MNNVLKYRLVALTLAVVFGLFNIGIPIVIASCPMAALMQGTTCGMCNEQDGRGTARITVEKNSSCCATIIVAGRNTNEFVQAKSSIPDVSRMLLVVLAENVHVSTLSSPVCVIPASASPPAVVDIPIFVSSLLI